MTYDEGEEMVLCGVKKYKEEKKQNNISDFHSWDNACFTPKQQHTVPARSFH